MCKILIDADGCPVVKETISLAQEYDIPVVIVCDTSHYFDDPYASVLMADKGKDQSDFLLLRHTQARDIVITQDYGLAALVLSKGAKALSQNAFSYTEDNIETLLASRHQHAQMRKHKHYGHIPKRTQSDNDAFVDALTSVLQELENHRK